MGTSLKVNPVAAIPTYVPPLTPRLLINREIVFAMGSEVRGARRAAGTVVAGGVVQPARARARAQDDQTDGKGGERGEFRFGRPDNYRDVLLQVWWRYCCALALRALIVAAGGLRSGRGGTR